jgi:Zn finger protein HypA/HybF involved in hydrogenase expression
MRSWKPEDIFDVKCPFCGAEIEFWKDEPALTCRQCAREVRNPRIDLGCAKWCKAARECLGQSPEEQAED